MLVSSVTESSVWTDVSDSVLEYSLHHRLQRFAKLHGVKDFLMTVSVYFVCEKCQ